MIGPISPLAYEASAPTAVNALGVTVIDGAPTLASAVSPLAYDLAAPFGLCQVIPTAVVADVNLAVSGQAAENALVNGMFNISREAIVINGARAAAARGGLYAVLAIEVVGIGLAAHDADYLFWTGKVPTCLFDAQHSITGCDNPAVSGGTLGRSTSTLQVVPPRPTDPNFISGPAGFGSQGFLSDDAPLPYYIGFENEPDATAPAQFVDVTQQLDPSLDWSTFQFGDFGFGDLTYSMPAGRTSFSTRIDDRADAGVFVDVDAQFDQLNGVVNWTFTAIDPVTLDEPIGNVLEGFLPPDITAPEGQGFVSYIVEPKTTDTTGTVINAKAGVVFNTNDPVITDPIFNTIDAGPPSSSVAALPSFSPGGFTVSWSGSDDTGGSGIASFDIYVSDNGGAFTLWQSDVAATSASYSGVDGHTYGFFSVATDNVGNVQPTPASVQATTLVDTVPPESSVSTQPSFSRATFTLSWSGSDNLGGSGLASYTIYVSDNGGSFTPFLINTTQTSAPFTGLDSHTYGFYSIAIDNAGNVQPTPSAAQATTTVDTTPPTSSVLSLPALENSTSFLVSWSGSDNPGGSGIASYAIFVSDNGGSFTPFLTNTTQTSATFTGQNDHTYGFYSVAIDNAGNVQPTPGSAQATTTVTAATTGAVGGVVFRDFNLNGAHDSGEPGLAGQTLFLDLNNNGVLDSGEPTATTNASGAFSFTGIAAGTYTLREVQLGGSVLSVPANGSYSATVVGGANLGGQNFGAILTSIAVPLTLPPTTPFPSQAIANADYVEAIFRAVLDRNADPGGLSFWAGNLTSGQLTRLQVVQGIRNSPEHFGQEIDVFYRTLLLRASDPTGRAFWVSQLQNGTREEQIAFQFLDSPEYLSKGDKFFVDAMYQSLLGRTFDPAGELSFLTALGDDASGNPTHMPTLAHQQVINDFLFSEESLSRLVEGYYEVFLQRQADPDGLKGWVTELQDGLPFLTIGEEFIASDEFFNKAASNH